MPSRPLSILFSGMIAADPHQGGATWAILQYLLGLRKLGHEVVFVEPVKPAKLQPSHATFEGSTNSDYFRAVMRQFGLENSSALLLTDTQRTVGLTYDDLRGYARRADLLLNVSGMLTDEQLIAPVPVRAFLDLDPAFVQVWYANYGINLGFDRHTHFVTVGTQIGKPSCPVPTCERSWLTTLQPVVLDEWPTVDHTQPCRYPGLTTIAHWRGYGSVEHEGIFYGQKAHSLRQFMDLPTLTAEPFMPAIAIHPAEVQDLQLLQTNHWRILDPGKVAATPDDYRRFIQGSKAEFGIAKLGYVASRCGWFSDRSACYLASGRPVIAQNTGFGNALPTGEGLFAFDTTEAVLAAIDEINRDYSRHARAARAIAEEHFDSDRVLRVLLKKLD